MTPSRKPGRSLVGPVVGTVVFVLLVPGTVVGGMPYLISRWVVAPPVLGLVFIRWLGAILSLGALPLFLDFLVRFVKDGLGTPAPAAEPQRLVTTGTFRHVRNPGYVAVVAMIAGQALFFGSMGLLAYAACVALGFHLFVVLWEEPHLRRKFGTEYDEYLRKVPRWIPGLRPRQPTGRK